MTAKRRTFLQATTLALLGPLVFTLLDGQTVAYALKGAADERALQAERSRVGRERGAMQARRALGREAPALQELLGRAAEKSARGVAPRGELRALDLRGRRVLSLLAAERHGIESIGDRLAKAGASPSILKRQESVLDSVRANERNISQSLDRLKESAARLGNTAGTARTVGALKQGDLARTLGDTRRSLDGLSAGAPAPAKRPDHVRPRGIVRPAARGAGSPVRGVMKHSMLGVPGANDPTRLGQAAPPAPVQLASGGPLFGSDAAFLAGVFAYLSDPPVDPDDYALTAETTPTESIKALSRDLEGSPARLFAWVQARIAYELYAGSSKGAGLTHLTRSGNQVDQSALLISLLREAGYACRYVHGRVRFDAAEVTGLLGVSSVEAAAAAFNEAGLDAAVVTGGGGVSGLDVSWTWVKALLPAHPYEGGVKKGQAAGSANWVYLDPAMKRHKVIAARDLGSESGADPAGLLREIESSDSIETSTQWVKGLPTALITERIDAWGGACRDAAEKAGLTVADLGGRLIPEEPAFALLPPAMPGEVVSEPSALIEEPTLSEDLSHTVTVRLLRERDRFELTNFSALVRELSGKRLALTFKGFDVDVDDPVIAEFLSDARFPAYLVELAPVITLESEPQGSPYTGPALAMGESLTVELSLEGPGLEAMTVDRTVAAGEALAIACAPGATDREELYRRLSTLRAIKDRIEDPGTPGIDGDIAGAVGEPLFAVGLGYLYEVSKLEGPLSAVHGVSLLRLPSVVTSGLELSVEYGSGMPMWVSSRGVGLGLELLSRSAVSSGGADDDERDFLIHEGLLSSAAAGTLLEEWLDGSGVSAVKVLREANDVTPDPVKLYRIDEANCGTFASELSLSDTLETAIADLCARGFEVTAPETEIQAGGLVTGAYAAYEPETGSTSFALDGEKGQAVRLFGESEPRPTPGELLTEGAPSHYGALVTPAIHFVQSIEDVSEEVGFGVSASSSCIKEWFKSPGEDDVVAFSSAMGALGGPLEERAARTRIYDIAVSPGIFSPALGNKAHVHAEFTRECEWVVTVSTDNEQHQEVYRETSSDPGNAPGYSLDVDWDGANAADGPYVVHIEGTPTQPGAEAPEAVERRVARDGAAPTATITAFNEYPSDPNEACQQFAAIYGVATDAHFREYRLTVHDSQNQTTDLMRSSREVETAGSLGLWTCKEFPSGEYTLRLEVEDTAGNVDFAELEVTGTGGADVTPPEVEITEPLDGAELTHEAEVAGTVDETTASTAYLYVDGRKRDEQPVSGGEFLFTLDTHGLSYGAHRLEVRAVDAAGNRGTSGERTVTAVNFISGVSVTPASISHNGDGFEDHAVIRAALGNQASWIVEIYQVSPRMLAKTIESTEAESDIDTQWDGDWDGATGVEEGAYEVIVSVDGKDEATPVDLNVSLTDHAPEVALEAPSENGEVRGLYRVLGTALDPEGKLSSWALSYSKRGESSWTAIAQGTTNVHSTLLASWDTTMLVNGFYDLKLEADDLGLLHTEVIQPCRLVGEAKVGHFTISMTDVSVPVAGVPITVSRTYDSRDTAVHDFGVGWRMDLKTTEAVKDEYGNVAFTLPDGRQTSFVLDPEPEADRYFTVRYESTSGVSDTLTNDGAKDLVLVDGEWLDWDGEVYDPDSFILNAVDGTQYKFNVEGVPGLPGGLQLMTEPNGNTLSFDANGIIHSAGKSVSFTRDNETYPTLITTVTDPADHETRYDYDDDGRLLSVTSPTGKTVTFTYDEETGVLLDIKAPGQDTPAITNYYDDDGRLWKHVDARGHEIVYAHNPNSRQEIVTDRNGGITVYEYNDRGLVTSITDPIDNRTGYEYDTDGNRTAEVDSLGNRTEYTYDGKGNMLTRKDALGHVWSYTYNDFGRVLTTTDPLNRTTRNVYDDKGNLTESYDALGTRTVLNVYDYDHHGNLTSTTDALDHTTTYVYDAYGNQTEAHYADGGKTVTGYDLNGNVTYQSVILPPDEDQQSPWDEGSYEWFVALLDGGETQSETIELNHYRSWSEYFEDGKLQRQCEPIVDDQSPTTCTEYTYTDAGQTDVVTDALGIKTKNLYDTLGQLTEVRYNVDDNGTPTIPDDDTWSARVQYGYDANGQKVWDKDRAGRMTHYQYDESGRLIKTTYEDGSSTETAYDRLGRVLSSTDRNGNVTRFEYDALGRQARVIDALNWTTEQTYDEIGNLAAVTDALKHTTRFVYDTLNRRPQTIFADGTSTKTGYDAAGRVILETDQEGIEKAFGYDVMGRLTSVTQSLNKVRKHGSDPAKDLVTHYEYDVRGNRTAIKDAMWQDGNPETFSPARRVTRFEYDVRGRLTAKIYPMYERDSELQTDSELYTYDELGRLTTKVTPKGEEITYTYDYEGRETERAYQYASDDVTWTFDYLTDGSRQSVTRTWAGSHPTHDWSYTYDPYTGRLASVTDPFDRTITYEYDHNGNRTAITTPQGKQTFAFDALNRLTSGKDRFPENPSTTYEFEGPARLKITHLPNGINSTYVYDDLDRLKSITHQSSEHLYSSFAYTLSPSGLRTGVIENLRPEGDPGETETFESPVAYAYDDLGRLISEERTGSYEPYAITYTYDDVGNREQLVRNGTTTTYEYNERDFLLTEQTTGEPDLTYDFDAAGNMILKQVETEPPVSHVYGWDPENRLRSYTVDLTPTAAFDYDAEGIRYYRDEPTATPANYTQFLVDINRPYAEVLEEYENAQPPLKMEYFQAGTLISQKPTGGEICYFMPDGQLSVRQITTPSNLVASMLSYETFGPDLASNAVGGTAYRYASQQFDGILAKYYQRARYLSPKTGRFSSADRFEGTLCEPLRHHKFVYVANNPVALADPDGNFFGILELILRYAYIGRVVHDTIGWHFRKGDPSHRHYDETINKIYGLEGQNTVRGGKMRPDLVDLLTGEVYEIKPRVAERAGASRLMVYLGLLDDAAKSAGTPRWHREGTSYVPPPRIPIPELSCGWRVYVEVSPPNDGLILYDIHDSVITAAEVGAIVAGAIILGILTFGSTRGGVVMRPPVPAVAA